MLSAAWLCLLFVCVTPSDILEDEIVSVTDVTAVLGGAIELPCALPTEGEIALVIWFKDGATSPIYSVDARNLPQQQQATHWTDERSLGGRSFFRAEGNSSRLSLERVRQQDAGSYRCRIDFKRAPTRNSVVNLFVVVPPHNITVVDERGIVVRDVIGPFPEGATPQLTCIATGGRPPPVVSWWLDGVEVNRTPAPAVTGPAGQPTAGYADTVSHVIRLPPLGRRYLHSELTCRASNHADVLLSTSVVIDMLLSPLVTQLLGDNRPLSAGRQYELTCQTVGSRPPANVSWWRDSLLLEGAREATTADGNVTKSTLSLSPVAEDSGRQLCCRAANVLLPPPEESEQLHDCWTLHVRYSPIVNLELGSNINGSAIREGVDVYFECNIRANPWVKKVVWRHNGRQLHHNPGAGTLLSNQTLVLQAVKRQRSGLYTCVASNSEGDTESNAFNLDVKYAPECVPGQQRVWGAARRETVSVPCVVEARPAATLFRWAFNSSAGGPSAPPAAVTTQPGRSVATHTPRSERDYGTLLCWARNDLGSQLHPCVFLVVPAGKPDPPRDCRVPSRSATSLQVSCARGSDGGLPPQHFTLELLAGRGGRLVANVTSRASPEFTVAGLEPGTTYHLRVYSSNGKGRSDTAAELNVTTLRASQQHRRIDAVSTAPSPPAAPLLPPPGWLVAVVAAAALLLCAAAGVAVARARGCRLRGRGRGRRGAHGDSTGSSSPSGKTPPPIQEDNPDVVPPRKDETELPGQAYKALQQYNIVVEARPVNVDSAAQTVLYSAVNTFPMTEAVVLAPCWPSPGSSEASAPLLAPAAPAAPSAPLPGHAAASPRLQDAETQTAAPQLLPPVTACVTASSAAPGAAPVGQQQHKESTV